jgi:phospholipid-translocating ATPase
MMVLVVVSSLLVFFWTGVFSAFKGSAFFYKAASEAFAQPTFWAVTCLTFTMALLPRFVIKFVQKAYFPYDVDIIREQVRQGKFDYLNKAAESEETKSEGSSNSDDLVVKPSKHSDPSFDEERRPIYPPSVAATATTHNNRSQNGSDGTDYLRNRHSLEPPVRPSYDRAGPSFDRVRQSMDRIRPSFEQSNDFTSAAMLTRFESSHSFGPIRSRMRDNYNYDTR